MENSNFNNVESVSEKMRTDEELLFKKEPRVEFRLR